MLNHLEKVRSVSLLKYRFRCSLTCVRQLILTMHYIVQNSVSKQQTGLIIFDFSKAFYTVAHRELLLTRTKYGITGNINKWIQSFMVHGKQ